ncbi:malonyl CoA-acyl carrier protein transacylase [Streptomyces capoamus]|uniref:Malonyl CoA-acyl carrier protein transacylase n=1 Tax=Streptomyces capoamus TaxID=68183 RepID=A0A919KFY1_9ACTN|nr:ACP S-malonyltransferase [Streptomyces capoamus]GGW13179.1 malonyl CoA-acyl carrier protein transacylase [Streptomyces libani subsp. rufus]GHG74562.1 malonyl CoA-acyl carrier protein transacylase [Streptomyces capoamus]
MSDLPVGLVFPGQGTQKQGMGEPWRETPSWALVARMSEAAGEDLEDLLLRTSAERLRRTDLAQLAVFTVSLVAHAEAERRGLLEPGPTACAGHSLGEYTALACAGVLTPLDAIALVAARGRAMRAAAEARPGAMYALVGAPFAEVEELTRQVRESVGDAWIANVNAPGQTVVSGSPEAMAGIAERSRSIGAKAFALQTGGAFHSPYMAPAIEELGMALQNAAFTGARFPVVANVDATVHADDGDWSGLAVRQLIAPVLWERCVGTLTGALGCRRLVEIGPGRTLAGLIRRIAPDVEVWSVDCPAALDALSGVRT